MKSAWLPAGILTVTVLAAACKDAPGRKVMLQDNDSGSTVPVNAGDTLCVALDANHTTGYRWIVSEIDTVRLRRLTRNYVPDTQERAGIVGSGGRSVLSFLAKKRGTGHLELVYRRPFDPDTVQAERTFRVRLDIRR